MNDNPYKSAGYVDDPGEYPSGIRSLDVTWKRATKVWLAYLWRSILAMIAAMIAGAIAGGILGFVLSILGASETLMSIVAGGVGFALGLGFSIIPIKLIIGKNYGEFSLLMVRNEV